MSFLFNFHNKNVIIYFWIKIKHCPCIQAHSSSALVLSAVILRKNIREGKAWYLSYVIELYFINWLRLSRPALCKTLLSGLDGHVLWLNSLLLDVSPPSVCSIFRSNISGSQMNSLSAGTGHRWHQERAVAQDSLFVWLIERLLLRIPHKDGGKMLSRREFNHRPWPSSPDNRVLQNCIYSFKYNFCNIGRFLLKLHTLWLGSSSSILLLKRFHVC